MNFRIRKTSDLKDLRVVLPRFKSENIENNAQLGDKFEELGKKYNATGAQIILAWILAQHSDCMYHIRYLQLLCVADL